jgi:hypothetical protein
VDTVDNRFRCRWEPVFCPPRLWATGVDNQGSLWTARSCAHPMHRQPPVLPSSVPRNTRVLPRPTHHVRVTAFTLPSDRPGSVAEQWTGMWRNEPLLCTTQGILWASGGQPRRGGPRRPFCPQSVDSGCPHIHMPLSCADSPWRVWPVETILDNSGIPRLWTARTPHFCGETDHPLGRIEHRGRVSLGCGTVGGRLAALRWPFGGPSGVFRRPVGGLAGVFRGRVRGPPVALGRPLSARSAAWGRRLAALTRPSRPCGRPCGSPAGARTAARRGTRSAPGAGLPGRSGGCSREPVSS